MNEKVCCLIGVFLIIIGIFFILFISFHSEFKIEKALCVDGDGDINLEGIMCEKEIVYFLGERDNPLTTFLTCIGILLAVLGMIIMLMGFFEVVNEY